MSDLELIFSMLGEASTTEIIKAQNPIGFIENKKVAKRGGDIAELQERSWNKQLVRKLLIRIIILA